MSTRKSIVLGDRVVDKISGFMGITVARTDWIYGCVRWGVARESLGDKGTINEPQWFDDDQLFIKDANAHLTPSLELAAPKPTAKRPSLSRARGGPDRGEGRDDPTETG